MDETKCDDTENTGEGGPIRIPRLYGDQAENLRTNIVDSYKMVHAQESLWVFHMRVSSDDGVSSAEFRVILRAASDGIGIGLNPTASVRLLRRTGYFGDEWW